MAQHSRIQRPRAENAALMFVNEDQESIQRGRLTNVISHARRFQTSRKHQEQRASAHQGAQYARSLVGWRMDNLSSLGNREVVESNTMSLEPSGGLRVDPFNSLPTERSNSDVMQMVDYYVQVFAIAKAGNFDACLGYNSYRKLCWPAAMQDSMLFEATLALSRAAWRSEMNVKIEDSFILVHRGVALSELREKFSDAVVNPTDKLIFTLDNLIDLAYMTHDDMAFQFHFAAFQMIGKRYINSQPPETELARIAAHRLASWAGVDEFRRGLDPTQNWLRSRPISEHQFLDVPAASIFDTAPAGIVKLVRSKKLSREVATMMSLLNARLKRPGSSSNFNSNHILTYIRLRNSELSDFESQVCLALLAIVSDTDNAGISETAPPDLVSRSFVNKKLRMCDGHDQERELERMCLIWCSLVLGTVLLRYTTPVNHVNGYGYQDIVKQESMRRIYTQTVRGQGHVILTALGRFIATDKSNFGPSIDYGVISEHFPATPSMIRSWQYYYDTTAERQRVWHSTGLLKVGAPIHGAEFDMIEYLVLRVSRGSLPLIDH